MAHWRFAKNDDGEESGINANYAAKFRGNRIPSLAREICQNSLDAALNGTVRVEFSLFDLPKEQFPEEVSYEEILHDCLKYWEKRKQNNEIKAFKKAYSVLKNKTIPVLRISDFNTTGVRKNTQSEWRNLIRSTGSCDKPEGANGSFGLGKAAPFACSNLLTLFYSTNTCEHDRMHQGVARFATFVDSADIEHRDVGYYCEGNSEPVSGELHLDPDFCRKPEEYGTDIYIMGFSMGDEVDWSVKLLGSIVDSFLLAIMQKRLEVVVQGTPLSSDTIGDFVKKHSDYIEQKSLYYNILTKSASYHKDLDFKGEKTIELWLTDNDSNAHRKVCMVRKNGMKIRELNNISSIPFAGIGWIKGDELNTILRGMETPEHTDWSIDYIDDPEQRRQGDRLLKELRKIIRSEVRTFLSSGNQKEMDAVGAGVLLPDELTAISASSQISEGNEERQQSGANITLESQYTPSVLPHGNSEQESSDTSLSASPNNARPDEADDDSDDPPMLPDSNETEGDTSPSDNTSTNNRDNTKPKDEETGKEEQNGQRKSATRKPISLTSLRSICINPLNGQYRLSTVPMHDGKNGELDIRISAETETFPADIQSAAVNGVPASISGSIVRGLTFHKGTPLVIEFTIPLEGYYSLEVSAYATQA